MVKTGADEIDVWFWTLDVEPGRRAALREILTAEEQARADRFAFPILRERWTAARGGLRSILARYVGGAPTALRFSLSKHGKPAFETPDAPHFNLTHSEGYAALAVAGAPVGVDLEELGEAHADVAQTHFSPQEAAVFAATPPDQQVAAFYRCWTAKEAFLKALGTGFSQPSDSFTIDFAPDAPIALTEAGWLGGEVGDWRFWPFQPHPRFVGAVCMRKPEGALACARYDWSPDGSTRVGQAWQ